jgi:hypothetical protein
MADSLPSDWFPGLNPEQHVNDQLDYPVYVGDYLVGDEVVSSHVVSAAEGLTIGNTSHTDDTITFWVSGGQVGESYNVTVSFNTNSSPQRKSTFVILFSIVESRTVRV